MMYLFANWKSHKNSIQARVWVESLDKHLSDHVKTLMKEMKLQIGVFPPTPLLAEVYAHLQKKDGYIVGAQDISPFAEGKHTGLVAAESIRGYATHVLIGHAECRARGDTQDTVLQKLARAETNALQSVLCITESSQYAANASYIAYEPLASIGSGAPASVEDVRMLKSTLSTLTVPFLYGGSITADSLHPFLSDAVVDGFLIGGASIDPETFAHLVEAAATHL